MQCQAGVNDVFHDDDVLTFYRNADVLLDVNRSRRCRCVTVTRHRHEIHFHAYFARNRPDQIGKKNETAFQDSDKRYCSTSIVRGNLPSHLSDTAPNFVFRDQNPARRRFHSAVSLWYKRGRFQRGRPMLRKAWFFSAAFILTSAFGFGQTPANQQRNRIEDYSIRGKLVIQNQHDLDQRIEVRLEKSALQVIQTTYTDASGNFDFRNLSPGAYYVSVNLEGYEPVRQLVEIYNTFGNSSVTVFLNKPSVEFRERPTGIDAADPDVVDINQMKENFPKKAVKNYEKAIKYKKNIPKKYVQNNEKANNKKKKGKLESAVKLLQEAVELAPNFFHAHNNLGIIFQSLKRYPDAEREYTRSHQLNAKNERPLVNLGSLYIEESNLQKIDKQAARSEERRVGKEYRSRGW